MKALSVILLAAVCFHSVTFAGSVQSSPLFGSWAVDIARLPMPPEARPKRATISFAREESGA